MLTEKSRPNLLRLLYPAAFFVFLLSIIYMADTANYNFAFRIVKIVPYGDKIGHIVLYGIMALLLNYGLNGKKWLRVEIGSLIVITFAFVEEVSQLYFPSRSFDWYDIAADIIGIIGAGIIFPFILRYFKIHRYNKNTQPSRG